MTKPCRNPECKTDRPVLKWLDARYCGGPCALEHKQALAAEAVSRIDEVIGGGPETPSSLPLPAERDPDVLRPTSYVATLTPDEVGPGAMLCVWRLGIDFRGLVRLTVDALVNPGLTADVALRALGWLPVTDWRDERHGMQVDVRPLSHAVLDRSVDRLPVNWRSFITPPITHPAGVIPPEVEQALTEQINSQAVAQFIANPPRGATPTMNDLMAALDGLGPARSPEPIEVTSREWEALKAACPPRPDYILGGQIGSLFGTPVKIVDPTPRPGWLWRAIKRVFG